MRKYTAVVLTFAFLFAVVGVIAAAEKAPDTVTLPAKNGDVKLDHKKHAAFKCDVCHHASKPEKALASPHQSCRACHTATVAAPMKTNVRAAFHNPAATAGVCIDCHKKEAAAGKKPAMKCMECHKRA